MRDIVTARPLRHCACALWCSVSGGSGPSLHHQPLAQQLELQNVAAHREGRHAMLSCG